LVRHAAMNYRPFRAHDEPTIYHEVSPTCIGCAASCPHKSVDKVKGDLVF